MKKAIVIILFSLQYTSLLVAREVRVVPLYQERLTGKWCGLFAHDSGGMWSTIKQRMDGAGDALTCALEALKKQTNGVYSLDKETMQKFESSITLKNGDVLCCLPVKHMTVPVLQKKMIKSVEQDTQKDKFVWLPMEDVLSHVTVVKIIRNMTMRYKFETITRTVLKSYWESLLQPRLNAAVNREKALGIIAKKASVKSSSKVVHRTKKELAPVEIESVAKKPVIKIARMKTFKVPATKYVKKQPGLKRAVKMVSKKSMKDQRA